MVVKKSRDDYERKIQEIINEEKDLDRALFVNYCKCTKKLKKDEKLKKGDEYPICTYSIYLNRKMKTPKGVQKKCKRYH